MPDDVIITAGSEVNSVYLILDGEVEILDYTAVMFPRLTKGQYFGGIIPNVVQLNDVRAIKISKIAIIDAPLMQQMREAQPQWALNLIRQERVYKLVMKFKDVLKANVEKRKENREKLQQKFHGISSKPSTLTKVDRRESLACPPSPSIARGINSSIGTKTTLHFEGPDKKQAGDPDSSFSSANSSFYNNSKLFPKEVVDRVRILKDQFFTSMPQNPGENIDEPSIMSQFSELNQANYQISRQDISDTASPLRKPGQYSQSSFRRDSKISLMKDDSSDGSGEISSPLLKGLRSPFPRSKKQEFTFAQTVKSYANEEEGSGVAGNSQSEQDKTSSKNSSNHEVDSDSPTQKDQTGEKTLSSQSQKSSSSPAHKSYYKVDENQVVMESENEYHSGTEDNVTTRNNYDESSYQDDGNGQNGLNVGKRVSSKFRFQAQQEDQQLKDLQFKDESQDSGQSHSSTGDKKNFSNDKIKLDNNNSENKQNENEEQKASNHELKINLSNNEDKKIKSPGPDGPIEIKLVPADDCVGASIEVDMKSGSGSSSGSNESSPTNSTRKVRPTLMRVSRPSLFMPKEQNPEQIIEEEEESKLSKVDSFTDTDEDDEDEDEEEDEIKTKPRISFHRQMTPSKDAGPNSLAQGVGGAGGVLKSVLKPRLSVFGPTVGALGLQKQGSDSPSDKSPAIHAQNFAKRNSVRFDVPPPVSFKKENLLGQTDEVKQKPLQSNGFLTPGGNNNSNNNQQKTVTDIRRKSVLDMSSNPLVKKIEGFQGVDLRKDFSMIVRHAALAQNDSQKNLILRKGTRISVKANPELIALSKDKSEEKNTSGFKETSLQLRRKSSIYTQDGGEGQKGGERSDSGSQNSQDEESQYTDRRFSSSPSKPSIFGSLRKSSLHDKETTSYRGSHISLPSSQPKISGTIHSIKTIGGYKKPTSNQLSSRKSLALRQSQLMQKRISGADFESFYDNLSRDLSYLPSFIKNDSNEDDLENESAESKQLRKSRQKDRLQTMKKALKKGRLNLPKSKIPLLVQRLLAEHQLTKGSKKLRYYIRPDSIWKSIYEAIHTVIIMYSAFAVPVMVCFNLSLNSALLALEFFCLTFQILWPVLFMRTAQYAYGFLTLDFKILFTSLREKGFLIEVLAMIPFNLLADMAGWEEPRILVGLLRMNRVLLITRLPAQLSQVSSYNPQLTRYLNIIKPILYLAFVWHFSSCLWAWLDQFNSVNDLHYYKVLDLIGAPLWQQYIFCLFFTMNIATSTGYPELKVYSNYERILFIIFIYIGDGLFALVFGWFAANSNTLSEKYDHIFEKIRKMDYLIKERAFKSNLKKKIESYFAYIVETRNQNQSCLEVLNDLLPPTIVKSMAFSQTKTVTVFPLLGEFAQNNVLTFEIVRILEQAIYLPHDYIVAKNDLGHEMYFLREGTVHMLSPNEKRVIAVLESGMFFGEFAIYTTTRRFTSFVASTFCLVYILHKERFQKILTNFPHNDFDFKIYATKRLEVLSSRNRKKALEFARSALKGDFSSNMDDSDKKDIPKLLKAAEIPLFQLENKSTILKTERKKKAGLNIINSDNSDIEDFENQDDSVISISSSVAEYVEDDELLNKEIDTKKNTLRTKSRDRERRFSRVKIGKEKSSSKSSGLVIKWGINMD